MPDETGASAPEFDGTLRQTEEALAETRGLSVPDGVEQKKEAPKVRGYVLTEFLGQGAYAQVWKAWQERTGKWVAVKVYTQQSGVNWLLLQREVERLTRLDKHPYVVSVLDADLTAQPPYYVTDLLEQGSLERYVNPKDPAPVGQAIEWMRQIAEAMEYVHGKGTLHCDLKPGNVLLDEQGHARVADFGQARILSDAGAALGTLFYMPPEQARLPGEGVQPDVKWDIYGLGATTYAILTGRAPYQESLRERMETSANLTERLKVYREMGQAAPPARVRDVRGKEIDPDLEAILGRCLETDPARRYGAMNAVLSDLRARDQNRPVSPLAHRRGYRAKKYVTRHLAVVVTVALALAGLTGALVEIVKERQSYKEQLAFSHVLHARHLAEKGDIAAAAAYCVESYAMHRSHLARCNALAYLGEVAKARFILGGGEGGAMVAELSPDGRTVLTARMDKMEAVLWSAATGERVGKAMKQKGKLWDVAFSPDGKLVATVGDDKAARIWDAARGDPVGDPIVHPGEVWRVAFTPDGGRIVTVSYNYDNYSFTLIAWDLKTRRRLPGDVSSHQWIEKIMVSPDGSFGVPVVLMSTTLPIWRIGPDGGDVKHVVWDGASTAAAISPDSRILAIGTANGVVSFWDARTGRRAGKDISHEKKWRIEVVSFSPDGTRVLTGGNDRTAQLWDFAARARLGKPMRHGWPVLTGSFSPDGRTILTGSIDRTARLWSADTQEPKGAPFLHDDWVMKCVFSRDGASFLSVCHDGTVRLWDVPGTRGRVRAIGRARGIVFLSEDGRRFAADHGQSLWTMDPRSSISIHDTMDGKMIGEHLRFAGDLAGVAFGPKDERVTVATQAGGFLIWDLAGGAGAVKFRWHDDAVHRAVFSPDGNRIVSFSNDGSARLWDAATGDPIGRPMRHAGEVLSAAFSPDGSRIFTTGIDKTARMWDGKTGEPARKVMWHGGFAQGLAVSPGGGLIATACNDGMVRFWDASTGELSGKPIVLGGQTWQVMFSPDGEEVLTTGEDRAARLWSVRTREPVGRPMVHDELITALAFSPDGRTILTGSQDDLACLWDADTGEPLGDPLACDGDVYAVGFRGGDSAPMLAVEGGGLLVWEVPWLKDPVGPRELRLRAEVATHRRLNRSGSVEVIPLAEWRSLAAEVAR